MKVLAIAFSEELKSLLSSALKGDAIHWIATKDQFFSEVDNYNDGMFSAVVCELSEGPEFALEVGQVMRSLCPQTPSFACALDKKEFAAKTIRKNGYSDVFLFPIDKGSFLEAIASAMTPEALAKRSYKRIMSPDLQAKSKLSFTTYVHLPLNNKYLVFANKDEEFTDKKAEKLTKFQVGSLYVDQKDSNRFYEYVAEQMKSADNSLSETERGEKLKSSIRSMFNELFDQNSEESFDHGKELMESCRGLVSTYIVGPGQKTDFHTRLLRTIGGVGMDYSHSADVSTLAALFGIALGSKKVEELAIAGFFHDVALASFPVEYGYEINPQWDEAIKKTFLDHPQQSLNIVKTKKMILPPEAEKMIFQHHEKFDGKGFPKGQAGDRILLEAQILSLADQFHYLTVARPGQARMSPLEALEVIGKNGSLGPALLNQARSLFNKK